MPDPATPYGGVGPVHPDDPPVDTSGGGGSAGATAANQTNGSQKTQIVDSAGTHTQPAGDAAGREIFVKMSDGTNALGTDANPVVTRAGAPQSSTDAGASLSLADTNSHQFASKATTIGKAWFCAPIANTKPVYIGRATGVTTSTGIELLPGDKIPLECANTNEYWAITGTATQTVQVVAL